MKNRYVYHYCAQYQVAPGSMKFIDGIAQMENKIKCMEDYTNLKNLIAIDHKDRKGMSLIALSLIGMEND